MRNKIREDAIRDDTQIKAIADFLQKGLPSQKKQQQQSKM
jgi:predicted N-formylglutamate amidohydrolase